MNQTNRYHQLGLWLSSRYQTDMIICRIYGKRWAFEWSNTDDIENARRIQIATTAGIIVPKYVTDDLASEIKHQAQLYWEEQTK